MDERTLKALKGSIRKWEGIVAGRVMDKGPDNCPLCKEFAIEAIYPCKGCPVMSATGEDSCFGTPYTDWHEAQLESVRGDCKAHDDETVMCAVLELEFLKSLLPKGK